MTKINLDSNITPYDLLDVVGSRVIISHVDRYAKRERMYYIGDVVQCYISDQPGKTEVVICMKNGFERIFIMGQDMVEIEVIDGEDNNDESK